MYLCPRCKTPLRLEEFSCGFMAYCWRCGWSGYEDERMKEPQGKEKGKCKEN